MKTTFELQVPKFENPFADRTILSDDERQISEQLALDGYSVIDFPCKDIDLIADSLVKKIN
tara:strand:- start:162 stop:344 length:183 start_codon:yes stop_codon:yes gene_type:complete